MNSMLHKMMQYLGFADDTKEEDEKKPHHEEWETSEITSVPKKGNVVNLHTPKQVKVVLCEPEAYEDAQSIADHLRSRRPVVLNLHKSPYDQAIRIVDFVSGTVYALGGRMEKIGQQIFLCAPENVDVQGTISKLMDGNQEV